MQADDAAQTEGGGAPRTAAPGETAPPEDSGGSRSPLADVRPALEDSGGLRPPLADPCPPLPEPRTPRPPEQEEYDVWWGSYSGWTMTVSMVVCLVLTGVIGWSAWFYLPRGWIQPAFLAGAGVLWLVQAQRWAFRFFGYNYRLTNRRLFVDKGLWWAQRVQAPLTAIARVEVIRSSYESLVRVGRVCVHFADAQMPALLLEGVRHPNQVADLIRVWSRRAGETK